MPRIKLCHWFAAVLLLFCSVTVYAELFAGSGAAKENPPRSCFPSGRAFEQSQTDRVELSVGKLRSIKHFIRS